MLLHYVSETDTTVLYIGFNQSSVMMEAANTVRNNGLVIRFGNDYIIFVMSTKQAMSMLQVV